MSPSKSRRRRPRKKQSNTKKILLIVALLAVVVTVIVAYTMLNNNNNGSTEPESGNLVLLETSMGNITIELRDDMPITTTNFKNLIQQGKYDNTIFHRVIEGFMIQGGDPTGTGYGDSSIPNIEDEFTDTNENNNGTIAMAKSSDASGNVIEDSGSSQFYINVDDNNYLDEDYSVFGKVVDGMDVVMAISKVATDSSNDKPLEDITLIKAQLID
jgi:peptidylprolyl isomerase